MIEAARELIEAELGDATRAERRSSSAAAAGLAVEALREPVAMEAEDPRHARVPLFLLVRAIRP